MARRGRGPREAILLNELMLVPIHNSPFPALNAFDITFDGRLSAGRK